MTIDNKKRNYMRRAFGGIKVSGHMLSQPCRVLSVSRDLHKTGRVASGDIGDVGMLNQELVRWDSLRHLSWSSKAILGN